MSVEMQEKIRNRGEEPRVAYRIAGLVFALGFVLALLGWVLWPKDLTRGAAYHQSATQNFKTGGADRRQIVAPGAMDPNMNTRRDTRVNGTSDEHAAISGPNLPGPTNYGADNSDYASRPDGDTNGTNLPQPLTRGQ